jgi:hypothetical protein
MYVSINFFFPVCRDSLILAVPVPRLARKLYGENYTGSSRDTSKLSHPLTKRSLDQSEFARHLRGLFAYELLYP